MVSLKAVIGIGCGAGVLVLAWMGQGGSAHQSAQVTSAVTATTALATNEQPAAQGTPDRSPLPSRVESTAAASMALGDPSVPALVTPPASSSTPAPTAQQARQYIAAAAAFMKAFARPSGSVSAERWWQEVKPLLSRQAAQDYAGTDPGNVPFTKVTGTPQMISVTSSSQAYGLAVVRVDTDAGSYLVTLRTEWGSIVVVSATPPSAGS